MTINQIPIPQCQGIPDFPDLLEITLPGGATLSQVISAVKAVPNSVDMGINLMQQVQPAMAPLIPIFDIVDTMATLFKVVQAIPESLGPPPDITKLTRLFPELNEKMNKLLKLIPQLSVPLMVKGLLDLLIATLHGVRSQLLALNQQMVSVTNAAARASLLSDPELTSIALCAQNNIEKQAKNIVQSLAALKNLINLMNLFMQMINGPQIPDFSSLTGKPLKEVIEPLNSMITMLKDIRKMVPVP